VRPWRAIWAAAACHSGDMDFELCYRPDMPAVLRARTRRCRELDRAPVAATRSGQKTPRRFLQGDQRAGDGSQLRSRSQFLGIRLPVTFDTCEIIEERWANWLRQHPVVAIETQADNLRRQKALYIDCGEKDQFNLLYGASRFVPRLNELGIAHRSEEFPDNHSGVDYRMDEGLPFLAKALSG
jgi:hypothetical protein